MNGNGKTLLQKMGTGQGYLKAGFLGFPKSGKTYTAALLALGTYKLFELKKPIAMFDTEGGLEYIAEKIKTETGNDLIGVRSHSFDDMLAVARECEKEASVLIVDSVTHTWRELCEAHLKKINADRASRNLTPKLKLEFQDWNIIKPYYAKWTDFYLNSKLHIIICGRAGWEWDFTEPDEETGKRELIKTGVKMKTESEFGFEPSLLVEMERIRDDKKLVHRATVIGDRFGVIDCQTKDNPDFSFFLPHLQKLQPGTHAPINTEVKSDTGVDANGLDNWGREKRNRTILCEEIEGELLRHWPSTKAEDKKAKLEAVEKYFGTRSWTQVENMSADKLRIGLDQMRIDLIEKNETQNSKPENEENHAL